MKKYPRGGPRRKKKEAQQTFRPLRLHSFFLQGHTHILIFILQKITGVVNSIFE